MKSENPILAILGLIMKIVITVVIIGAIYKGAIYCHEFGYRIFNEPPVSPEGLGRTVTVNITEDMSPRQIGKLLEAKGLIRNSWLFFCQYHASEYKEDVQPGTYEMSSSMTAEEMMKLMATPKEETEEITGGIDAMEGEDIMSDFSSEGQGFGEVYNDDFGGDYTDDYYENVDGNYEVTP